MKETLDEKWIKFNNEQRWLKTYKIVWDTITYSTETGIKSTEHTSVITARSFLDALAKATVELHKCQAQNIKTIAFQTMVKITEGVRNEL